MDLVCKPNATLEAGNYVYEVLLAVDNTEILILFADFLLELLFIPFGSYLVCMAA